MKYSESNKPMVCMMTQSTCYKGTNEMTPLGVLWHSTGANNPELRRYVQPDDNAPNRTELLALLGKNAYNNDWNHVYRKAGLNCWIGKLADGTVTTVQTMPWNYKPQGCGAAYTNGPSCNDGWIQFEICEDNLTNKAYFDQVYNEACEITAYLCNMYNLDPHGTVTYSGVKVPVILCHADSYKLGLGSNHGDVYNWFNKYGKTMDDVRNDVAKLMGENISKPITPAPITPAAPETGEMFRVRKSQEDSESQIGAYKILDNAKQACDKAGVAYHVYNSKGEEVYPNKKIDISKVDTSAADPKKVWNFLKQKGLNDYGIAGLMGNLYAESGLRSTNLQNSYEKSLGMTDAEYTASVDAEIYDNFVKDSAGYGLAQWTYWSRKQAMLNYHKATGKSIGDLDTQLEFLVKELSENYKNVWNTLKTATSITEASNAVLLQFERPADQSLTVQTNRANFSKQYYDKYHIAKVETETAVNNIQKNDIVKIRKDAVYYGGKSSIPSWVIAKNWIVKEVSGNRAIIDKSEDGKNAINSPIDVKYLELVGKKKEEFKPYLVKVNVDKLNYRQGPGLNYSAKGTVSRNEVYTIVEEQDGWGKLKSGAGWISLSYVIKV